MKIGVARETFPGERRVALVPAGIAPLVKAGGEILVEAGAGEAAGFADSLYVERGGKIAAGRDDVFACDVVLQVRALGANLKHGRDDLARMRGGPIVIGMCDPLGEPAAVQEIAATGATLLALELVPRITRAQAMDVLSSMATIAGYRAVLLAANELPKMFPMVTYAAGMLRPARLLIIGAGVAGLRAIATAKSLGAVVEAHDIRPNSREEVQSVGARFVELKLEGNTQDAGGYAKALTEADYDRQRELIAEHAAGSDAVITTAAIPGRRSPLLVTEKAVREMSPGSVIIDLAAERGGNCELTKADERVIAHGVTILGPTNLASEVPRHASEMFSGNVVRLVTSLIKDKELCVDQDDEIVRESLAAKDGEVLIPRLREILALPPLTATAEKESSLESQIRGTSGSQADDTIRVGNLTDDEDEGGSEPAAGESDEHEDQVREDQDNDHGDGGSQDSGGSEDERTPGDER